MPRQLVDGVYEHLVTEELDAALDALDPARKRELASLADSDAHVALARHLGREIERALAALPHRNRAEAARALVERVLDELAAAAREHGDNAEADVILEQRVSPPPRQLRAIHRAVAPVRPETPLSISTLLTHNRGEPRLGHEIAREIATADRIDAVIAFVTVRGVAALRDALEDFSRHPGRRMRLITTTFTGTTEVKALDMLAALPGVRIKVSYDTRRTRLHAKAWLFHRMSGLSTAYIGSANLTATALGSGQEWMVKLCAADMPHVIDKVAGTFDTLWSDPELFDHDPADAAQRDRLRVALGAERDDSALGALLDQRPFPFQEAILDRLAAERAVHGRRRNLVVAATGTGKTVIAALDYARIAQAAGVRPRLLVLAHRRELLVQARDTFRHALHDGAFGELSTGHDRPRRFDHVFATIHSAAGLVAELGVDHWSHVIVDECHHVPARSYQAIVPRLAPDILVGLTATPERSDGRSLLPDFDGHIAAELRLWHALERQLLAPFEYYGISDNTDLSHVRWSKTGYDISELQDIYTGNDARVSIILNQLDRHVGDVATMRALGFCVSVEHAEYMARRFTASGVPALAVHGKVPDDVRADAPRRLREREVNVLFTCDLYNEGVDLPFVDTLLLLRPTMSATLFLQQLGRGLRHHPGKTSCLVLDFIGQHRGEFRFDAVLSAFTGVPRGRLERAVEQGFPFLPSGCAVDLDAQAREVILRSLRQAIADARRLTDELRELAGAGTGPVRLRDFLDHTGRDLDDVYTRTRGWADIRRRAGLITADAEDLDLSRRLGWLTHIDEPGRLRAYRAHLGAAPEPAPLSARDRVRLHMLHVQLHDRGVMRAAEDTVRYFAARPAAVTELDELCEVLEDRVATAEDIYPVPGWPLALHRHYQRREIMAAVGRAVPGTRPSIPQAGIYRLQDSRRELLFVTLDKSGTSFSPTTRYRDYAISRERFHWETQAAASVSRASGRRYTDSPGNGWTFYLFVRTDPSAPYAFLGPVRYLEHAGDRPIAITWQLERPMPAHLHDRYATLASL